MSVWTKGLCIAAVSMALAGCGAMKQKLPGGASGGGISKPDMPDGVTCDDDRGVAELGKKMEDKAFEGMIGAQSALASLYEAAGKKTDAEKTRAEVKSWKENRAKAPAGMERIKIVSATSDKIAKGAQYIQSQNKTDAATVAALKAARMDLRKALVYVAWGAYIGKPVPEKSKEAVDASKACATKVKPAVDAAAGLTSLLGNMKKSFSAVDAAAQKAGAGELTEEEKQAQQSETGAPDGLGV